MSKQDLRKADVITSVLLIGLGIAVLWEASRMPISGDYGGKPIYWYTSPAFFPIVLGAGIVLISCGILWRALRDQAWSGLARWVGERLNTLPTSIRARRMIGVWGLIGGYILALSLHPFGTLARHLERVAVLYITPFSFMLEPEGINYTLCSFLFLLTFMAVYHRPKRAMARWTYWMLIGGISLLLSWGVGFVFTQYLHAPLPWLDYQHFGADQPV